MDSDTQDLGRQLLERCWTSQRDFTVIPAIASDHFKRADPAGCIRWIDKLRDAPSGSLPLEQEFETALLLARAFSGSGEPSKADACLERLETRLHEQYGRIVRIRLEEGLRLADVEGRSPTSGTEYSPDSALRGNEEAPVNTPELSTPKLRLKRIIMIKAVVTEAFKDNLVGELGRATTNIEKSLRESVSANVSGADPLLQLLETKLEQLWKVTEYLQQHAEEGVAVTSGGEMESSMMEIAKAQEEQRRLGIELSSVLQQQLPGKLQEEVGKQLGAILDLRQRMGQAKELEIGSEFPQGPLEGEVEVSVGDNLYELVESTEILVKDGIVIEIRTPTEEILTSLGPRE